MVRVGPGKDADFGEMTYFAIEAEGRSQAPQAGNRPSRRSLIGCIGLNHNVLLGALPAKGHSVAWQCRRGGLMSFALYLVGFLILIGGLIYGAALMHVP